MVFTFMVFTFNGRQADGVQAMSISIAAMG